MWIQYNVEDISDHIHQANVFKKCNIYRVRMFSESFSVQHLGIGIAAGRDQWFYAVSTAVNGGVHESGHHYLG